MKKVISLFLTVVMCLSLGVPAFAADVDTGDSIVVDQDAGIAAQADTGTASDMRLTLPTAITVYDDRMGGYTVGAAEVRNDSEAKATITGVAVTPAQHWSIMDWDSTRANVPVNSKTFSMKVFSTAIDTEGNLPDGTTLPQVAGGSASDMDVSFWMAPQSDAYGEQQVADIVVTAEFEELPVYAILYDDGELVFQKGSTPEEGRTVTATYAGVETIEYQPWSSEYSSIKTVTFNCDVAPVSTGSWFQFCSNLTTINGLEKLDTSSVSNMGYMFQGCSSLEHLDVSHFDTSRVIHMFSMFYDCSSLRSLDISGWDTSKVTNMRGMFRMCSSLTSIDLSNFDTGKVTTMNGMFFECSNLTSLDVSSFDTASVTDMDVMFANCPNLTTIYANASFTTAGISDYHIDMFRGCNALVGGNGTKFNDLHDKEYARIDAPGTPGYFTALPGTETVSMDAAALDSITATPPATDAVTAPAESDNTYEVGDDTDIVEVPETPDVTPEPELQPSPEPEQEEEPKQEPGSEPEPTPEPTPEPEQEPEQETPAANSDPVTKPDEVTPEKPDDGDGEELGTGETEAGDELIPEQTATA